jgi:phosphomannomutase
MKIIIDTEHETKEGILAAIKMLSVLAGEEKHDETAQFVSEMPGLPSVNDSFATHEEKSKAEEGFINIFEGEKIPENKKPEGLSEDDFDFETY